MTNLVVEVPQQEIIVTSSGGGVTAHSLLTGLADDDHPQYLLVDGTRAMTGDLLFTADNAHDIGANGATRPRDAYVGRKLVVGSTTLGVDEQYAAFFYAKQSEGRSAANFLSDAGADPSTFNRVFQFTNEANSLSFGSFSVSSNTLRLTSNGTKLSLNGQNNTADALTLRVNGVAVLSVGGISGAEKVILMASAAGAARFNMPHGAAPTIPVDGDVWTTTAGLFVQVNGGTVGPLT